MESTEAYSQRLMQNLYRIARSRHAVFKDILSEYGVTLHQFHLLLHIKMDEKANVSDMGELMLVSVPTVSRMIDTVSDMGLVRKKKVSGNKRSTYLELTARGKKVVDEIGKRQIEALTRVLEEVPSDELKVFMGVTDRIAGEMVSGLNNERV